MLHRELIRFGDAARLVRTLVPVIGDSDLMDKQLIDQILKPPKVGS